MNNLKAAVDRLAENLRDAEETINDRTVHSMVQDEARKNIPAFKTALVALREQMKRSEGCEFCRPNDWERKPLGTFEIIRDDYSTEEHEIGIDDFEGGYRIATTIMFRGPSFDINYCPVCGKELFGNPDQAKEGGE